MKHELTEYQGRIKCTVCTLTWKSKPSTDCVGVRVFDGLWETAFKEAESALGFLPMTKTQLNDAGYQTGVKLPAPVAALKWSKSKSGYLFLYNPNDATPKRVMSAAQQTAIAAAQKALCCQRCANRLDQRNIKVRYCDHCQMVEWAKQMLDEGAIIFDSETTGLDTLHDEMVQVAIINSAGDVLLDTLIKPLNADKLYTSRGGRCAFDIHGIGADMLADAPSFVDVYPQIRRIFGSAKNIIVYNWDYDIDMLNNLVRVHELDTMELPLTTRAHCAMEKYAQYCGERRYDGSYRWQRLLGGNHSAIGDCRATLRLIQKMADGSW